GSGGIPREARGRVLRPAGRARAPGEPRRPRRPAPLAADRPTALAACASAPRPRDGLVVPLAPCCGRQLGDRARPRHRSRRAPRLDGARRALLDARAGLCLARVRSVPRLPRLGGHVSRRPRNRAATATGTLEDAPAPAARGSGLRPDSSSRDRPAGARRDRVVHRARDRTDAERDARPDGVLPAVQRADVCLSAASHRPLPDSGERERLPVRGGIEMEAGATDNSIADAAGRHPIGLIVTDDLRRSRLTVFFRLLLAIPQALWLSIWSIAVALTVLIAWFAALVTGRVPDRLHSFNASFLRYATRVSGYLFLLADPWPWFTNAEPYP